MNNKQLAVLLREYVHALGAEIQALYEALDRDREHERKLEWWDKEEDVKAVSFGYLPLAARQDPDRFEERETGDFLLLDGLQALAERMEKSIRQLTRRRKS